MPEDSKLKERLVAGFERDGHRRRFDPGAKRELVQACLQPGVSVARIALEHGLNANLLRKWISQYGPQAGCEVARDGAAAAPAFVPVVPIGCAEAVACETSVPALAIQTSRLVAEMPNGVVLKFECASNDRTLVTAIVETLGRSHVPVRR
ncbi:transposase IS3/IS911 family protein [Caballeronia calidae]|uniref:Transposase IS3/IS911 family protein n=1 Tax=Caballeronia calidae TaxID=1777139 RepID=A0A158EKD8_9BURK|nr:transposase [Caballeronia calidae]SAL07362.1 transposase IS3/IS911 family protein [Caballeronia calidae]